MTGLLFLVIYCAGWLISLPLIARFSYSPKSSYPDPPYTETKIGATGMATFAAFFWPLVLAGIPIAAFLKTAAYLIFDKDWGYFKTKVRGGWERNDG